VKGDVQLFVGGGRAVARRHGRGQADRCARPPRSRGCEAARAVPLIPADDHFRPRRRHLLPREPAGEGGNNERPNPLVTLSLKPEPGGEVRAEVGLLRDDGSQAVRRAYRQDKAAGPTADVPRAAMPSPDLRGRRRSIAAEAGGEDEPRGQGRRQSFSRSAYIPGSCRRSSARTNG
jgi:hypothetical protein